MRCQPILAALGQRTFVLAGPPAAANVVKRSGNVLIAAVIEGLAEAIALARKAGIDPRAYLDILTNTPFTAPVYKTYGGSSSTGNTIRWGSPRRLASRACA